MRSRALSIVVVLALSALAEEPGLKRGFDAGKLYNFGGIDTVNTYNGNLLVQIPIGPTYPVNGGLSYSLGLTFNSKVWEYQDISTYTLAVPSRQSNAGLGWTLSLGRLLTADNSFNDAPVWSYQDRDTSVRFTYDTLHPGTSSATNVLYSNDSTYLRTKTASTPTVEFPDGTIHKFDATSGDLKEIADRFGNKITITPITNMSITPCLSTDTMAWKITDSENARTNYVCFKKFNLTYDSVYDNGNMVERVVLAAPPVTEGGAARQTSYIFGYGTPTIHRGPHSTYPNNSTVQVPQLTDLTLPDGSGYHFTYNTTTANDSGTISSLRLPTGALIGYTYQYFETPVDACDHGTWTRFLIGVGQRTISGPKIPTATWSYTRSLKSPPASFTVLCEVHNVPTSSLPPPEEMITAVTDPDGNVTEHYYSVWPDTDPTSQTNPHGFLPEEYSYPFTHNVMSGGYFLSTRVYTAAGYAADPKTPLRSTYVAYAKDTSRCAGGHSAAYCQNDNRRLSHERIVYHDDGNRIADTDYTDFDGVGHFRAVALGGTFTSGDQTTVTGYNKIVANVNPLSVDPNALDTGTYPGGFALPPTSHAWVLNTASYVTVTKTADSTTANRYMCYDSLTGFLRASRVGSGTSNTDAVTVFTADTSGNRNKEQDYGGDVLHNAPTSEPLCATATTPPSQAEYTITHTHSVGLPVTSSYSGVTFKSLDQTIDRTSGFITSWRDTSSFETKYTYDPAFRLTGVTPPAGLAATTYTFTNGTGFENGNFAPARVKETIASGNAMLGTTGSAENEYQYDALGRLWRTKKRLPDVSGSPVWNVREKLFTANGNLASSSEPEKLVVPQSGTEYDFTPSHQTLYGGYDPFGRTTSITAPDNHQTLLSYKGDRSTTRTITIATGRTSGEESVPSTETYDRQGRLESISEAEVQDRDTNQNVTADYTVATSYTYDVRGNLATVSMPRDGTSQSRSFTYDGRGFLTAEQHPEIGAAGNGTTSYSNYDSRGHAHRKVTGASGGAFDLSFEYDSAERLTKVLNGSTLLKQFVYDDQNGDVSLYCVNNPRCQGKLVASVRWNYTADIGDIPVSDAFQYEGVAGQTSRRDFTIGSTTSFDGLTFAAAQTYNDLGNVYKITYPFRKDSSGSPIASERTRVAEYDYTNGFLSAVKEPNGTSWASSISYQGNELVDVIKHGSGSSIATEAWASDSSGMPRVASITTTASDGSTAYSSGAYSYDGAGNIKQIGATNYAYDFFNRLHKSSNSPAAYTEYAYDGWGNRLGYWTKLTATPCFTDGRGVQHCQPQPKFVTEKLSGSTNHYLRSTYDAAGNVVADNARTFEYDSLSMMTSAAVKGRQFRYLYASDDERIAIVERVTLANALVKNKTTWTIRAFTPQLLAEWADDSTTGTRTISWKEDEIWRGATVIANEVTGTTKQYTVDHLGSPRNVLNASGLSVGSQDFDAFGTGGTTTGGALQFTGQERDGSNVAGGLPDLPDSFHARRYDALEGRFLSVDSHTGTPTVPQSWNRYSYARNEPLKYVDPTGADVALASGDHQNEVREMLIQTLQHRQGRADFAEIAMDPSVLAVYSDVRINAIPDVFRMLQAGSYHVILASANPDHVPPRTTTVDVSLDTLGIHFLHKVDPSGVTTTAHENFHTVKMVRKTPYPQIARDDQTGAAERYGRAVATSPIDMSRKLAEVYLNYYLGIHEERMRLLLWGIRSAIGSR